MLNAIFPTNTQNTTELPFYLNSVGVHFEEKFTHRPQGYPYPQWMQTVAGEGLFTVNGEKYLLTESKGIYIPAYTPHAYHPISNSWRTSWISFSGNHIDETLKTLQLFQIKVIDISSNNMILQMIDEIFRTASTNYSLNSLVISTYIYTLLIEMNRLATTEIKSSQGEKSKFSSILQYIDQYYMMDLSIQELANFIQVSPQYLCKLFKKELNKRPFEYIQEVRINKSKSLLLTMQNPSIKDIASAVGFMHPSYFGSVFKKYEKITPSEFLKINHRGA